MKPYQKAIEDQVESIIRNNKINTIPIDVVKLINNYDVEVKEDDLGEDISGVLALKEGKATIGVHKDHVPKRKRFTLAHEFGHFILHRESQDLFLDNKRLLAFRNEESSSGEVKMERQANAFAASLLMPKIFVEREIERNQYDLDHIEDVVDKLADAFDVSTMAMTFRLVNLGYIRH